MTATKIKNDPPVHAWEALNGMYFKFDSFDGDKITPANEQWHFYGDQVDGFQTTSGKPWSGWCQGYCDGFFTVLVNNTKIVYTVYLIRYPNSYPNYNAYLIVRDSTPGDTYGKILFKGVPTSGKE